MSSAEKNFPNLLLFQLKGDGLGIVKGTLVLLLLLLFAATAANAQDHNKMKNLGKDIGQQLLDNTFEPLHFEKTPYRSVMKVKKKNFIQKVNPIPYLSSGLMFTYQRFLSPQLQANCMYHTSCSEYAKISVEQLGLFKGVMLGFYQFQSCFSRVNYDYPEYKIGQDHKIINQVGLEK
jgi:putative component of membrane protein insertase Oxa1/YidC/SpoIIIJ protein YidD